ncbi:glycoside hydrolase family 2 protein [Acinetobacter bereziniae]|uniref:glycoside hydrolase family 2 protein n=1 Tax=Acinetobacter bereziniae TaxID=106648 RepID=UPI0018DD74CB|nr:glycoside hydrolase family 2 TIM barrel-domain containing protein [Acinetobacter bereziniae]MBI0395418.1 beta galactosidase jelly roll domain-containing protein [Acinetobacter bereziniae]
MHQIPKIQIALGKLFLISTLTACIYACGNDKASSQMNLPTPNVESVRTNKILNHQNWKFILDDNHLDFSSASQKLSTSGSLVKLPHTWNANDAATTNATIDYHRGVGWYQLEFEYSEQNNQSKWLQFDGASIVTEVWLNGKKLGSHGGAFTAFRFDVSKLLKNGKNILIVKCDNSKPLTGSDSTAIAPLGGDFNMAGGLYRGVSLIATPELVSIALNDFGSTGVFINTKNINNIRSSGESLFGDAQINIKTKLTNNSNESANYTVRSSLIDKDKKVAVSGSKSLKLAALTNSEIEQDIGLTSAHLWNGITDPYLYDLVVEIIDDSGKIIDKSVQQYGIRQIKFDAENGFYLNGKSYRLNGVNVHQDALGKAWAISNSDVDERMSAVMDIGANAVRFAHYPYSEYAYSKADQLGLIVWAEAPFVNQSLTGSQGRNGVVNGDCTNSSKVPESFVKNLIQQTQEMVRQNYNHTSIGMWSIANEVNTIALCQGVDTVTPLLHTLNDLVHAEDPSRVTTLADMVQGRENSFPEYSRIGTGGITDVVGYNRYFGWYYSVVELVNDFSKHLDELHALFPKQSLGISEYGAGAAITHSSDNPLGGQTNNFDSSNGAEVNY